MSRGEPRWFDSHCHLQDLENPLGAIERGAQAGVVYEICVGTDLATSRAALQIAADATVTGARIWSTAGLHPHDATDGLVDLEVLFGMMFGDDHDAQPRGAPGTVVAIGECGLDYFYEHSPRAIQREVFARQIALAHRYHTSLVVHTRDAWDDTLAVLRAEGPPERMVVHCFSGGTEEARRCLELGAYLSFSGIVTFKNAEAVREAAKLCPADRLMLETDAPFLTPVPHRGEKNEPAFVPHVGQAIALVRGMAIDDLAEITTANAVRAFALVP